jgi:tRNA A37 threonylcarbamoyladenosine synthetase subunit TsaC/SUA5/YrdC
VNLLRSRAAAARMLAEGGLVLMPTDTLPGLHCRADRPDAVGRLRRMKGRPEGKLFLLLCSSLRQVRTLAELSSRRVLAYCQTCWPGPFTLIGSGGGTGWARQFLQGGGTADTGCGRSAPVDRRGQGCPRLNERQPGWP